MIYTAEQNKRNKVRNPSETKHLLCLHRSNLQINVLPKKRRVKKDGVEKNSTRVVPQFYLK